MWPENEVNDLERRRILSHPREISWLLSLFESERLTPSVREYDALMSDTDAVPPTPPEPVAFDKSEPRFAKLYQNAVRLYKRFAQVLWERTHFFMPADTTVDPKTGKAVGKSRADFLARRRKRNSQLTPYWHGHLQAIVDLLESGVDVDILLDPFFYWPPAYGVLIMIPSEGEDVEACCDRLDEFEPERLYFRNKGGLFVKAVQVEEEVIQVEGQEVF
ncbi:hypothetical protein P43SY_011571 [Pythium insidiosum]|uniref:Uncharacterized protein n=1 Tax=Pythium insidiosum TaxID=114742 RepID=A0AAD5L7W4_PYTIN|nr:hypothetical protein P43SY_011571 [Pythium insidiosum]